MMERLREDWATGFLAGLVAAEAYLRMSPSAAKSGINRYKELAHAEIASVINGEAEWQSWMIELEMQRWETDRLEAAR